MDDRTAIIVALLTSGGIFAIIGAAINGIFTKRKLGAEATEIITKAASGVVTDLRRSLEDSRAEMDRMKTNHAAVLAAMRGDSQAALERLEKQHSDEREEWRRVLQLHVAWDAIAIAKMAEIGVELPPAPPLLPPVDRR